MEVCVGGGVEKKEGGMAGGGGGGGARERRDQGQLCLACLVTPSKGCDVSML